MKLALLKGNRFNPWHLQAFQQLGEDVEVTAFRAESEVQQYFRERDDGSLAFKEEAIFFDTQTGPAWMRMYNVLRERYARYQPEIVPFADRLEGFDVIQSWELFTDWTEQALEAKRRYNIPVSLMIWDNIPFNGEGNSRRRDLKRRAVAEADRFIVHTERSRRVLDMEGVDSDRVELIHPGVDEEHFAPGEGDRERFGLKDDEFVILFVGWLLPRKGLDFLILALRELVHDRELQDKRIRLAVVGSGPGRDRIDALLERTELTDRCTFLGTYPYDEMPEVYRSADVFVLPSIATEDWQEQFGMSLIEAMSCGVPVVASRSGAIPEIAGDAGILCQPNDFLSLYEALKRLISDEVLCGDMAKAGRERVMSRFRLDSYAEALGRVYGELQA